MASTETEPWVTLMETPARFVPKGNAEALTPVAGPIRLPNMEKKEPRAMDAEGKPGVRRLAALTMPFGVMSGCATAGPGHRQADRDKASRNSFVSLCFKSTSGSCVERVYRYV